MENVSYYLALYSYECDLLIHWLVLRGVCMCK